MSYTNDKYIEQDQYQDDRRVPTPCRLCNGTGKIRFDYINKDKKIINGFTFLPGVNVTYNDCPECPKDEGAVKLVAFKQYEPEQDPNAIHGTCKSCKSEDVLIDSNGYCFNC